MSFAFPKALRLLKGSDFKRIKGTRLKASSQHLLLLAKPSDCANPRLGLAVAKRHVKHAVDRNRIKRVARESFRHHINELPNIDIMLLVRSGVTQLNNEELTLCLEKFWKQLARRASDCSSS